MRDREREKERERERIKIKEPAQYSISFILFFLFHHSRKVTLARPKVNCNTTPTFFLDFSMEYMIEMLIRTPHVSK